MTILKLNQMRVDCDNCGACDWVTAKTKKEAIKILQQNTKWTNCGKHDYCPTCSNIVRHISEAST